MSLDYTSKKMGLGSYIGFFSIKTNSQEETLAIIRKIEYHRFDLNYKNLFIEPELLSSNEELVILDINMYNNRFLKKKDLMAIKEKIEILLDVKNMSVYINDTIIRRSKEGKKFEN